MKVDELIDELAEFIVDRYSIFMGIEEMKTFGYNIINLHLDLGRDIEYASISFRYIVAIDELEPIAIVIHPKKDKVKNLNLDKVLKVLNSYGGYIYGSQEDIGFLIPLQNTRLSYVVKVVIPSILEYMFGYHVKPLIIGHTLDIYHHDVQQT